MEVLAFSQKQNRINKLFEMNEMLHFEVSQHVLTQFCLEPYTTELPIATQYHYAVSTQPNSHVHLLARKHSFIAKTVCMS